MNECDDLEEIAKGVAMIFCMVFAFVLTIGTGGIGIIFAIPLVLVAVKLYSDLDHGQGGGPMGEYP